MRPSSFNPAKKHTLPTINQSLHHSIKVRRACASEGKERYQRVLYQSNQSIQPEGWIFLPVGILSSIKQAVTHQIKCQRVWAHQASIPSFTQVPKVPFDLSISPSTQNEYSLPVGNRFLFIAAFTHQIQQADSDNYPSILSPPLLYLLLLLRQFV